MSHDELHGVRVAAKLAGEELSVVVLQVVVEGRLILQFSFTLAIWKKYH